MGASASIFLVFFHFFLKLGVDLNEDLPYTLNMVDGKDFSMTKLSDVEFLALERYSNGRLKDIANVFLDLTDAQIEQLHSDDWSYYQELMEELNYEISLMMECA
jgi:hypothetical protein